METTKHRGDYHRGQDTPITRLTGVRSLRRLKQYFFVPEFRIGGKYSIGDPSAYERGAPDGVTLESLGVGPLRTAYIAVGTPNRDSSGRITNAVLISSYYSGDSSWLYYYWHEGQRGNDYSLGSVVGPGKLIDTNRSFVVFLDALGLWGASKPSDGLGLDFPQYSMFDVVQANYRLLVDELNIGKVRLATGVSMGAIQSYVWAIMHPEFVEAILPIGGSVSTLNDPSLRWLFRLMSQAMMSDPVWQETQGRYYHLPKKERPNRGMMFGWSILMHSALDLDHRSSQGWSEVRKEVFSWEPDGDTGALLREKAREYDVNDLLIRNRAQDEFHIETYLSRMQAKTLVVHVSNDLWLRAELARRSAERIPGAAFVSFEDPLAHFAVFRAPNAVRAEIESFMAGI